MKVLVSPDAVAFILAAGGRLYVWLEPRRCCTGGFTFLGASTRPPRRLRPGAPAAFELVRIAEFDLYFAFGRGGPPDELHLELRGWASRRVEAYWNGRALVEPA